jgi:hypothetical protein
MRTENLGVNAGIGSPGTCGGCLFIEDGAQGIIEDLLNCQ